MSLAGKPVVRDVGCIAPCIHDRRLRSNLAQAIFAHGATLPQMTLATDCGSMEFPQEAQMLNARYVSKHGTGMKLLGEADILALDLTVQSRTAARAALFICDECMAPVSPVFVKKDVPDRKRSPRSYFRVLKESSHQPGCPHLITVTEATTTSGKTEGGRASRHAAPAVFLDQPAADGLHGSVVPTGSLLTSGGTRGAVRTAGTTGRYSVSPVRTLRGLAVPWHAAPDAVNANPLDIPDCPAISYAGAFRGVDAHMGRSPPPFRCVFYITRPVVIAKTSGFELRSGARSGDGRFLNAYIPTRYPDGPLPALAIERLRLAAAGQCVTAYLLCRFAVSGTGKAWLLEPPESRHVWVEMDTPMFAAPQDKP